jgi:carbohydrate kinase (thermoresistant glucokinase family)
MAPSSRLVLVMGAAGSGKTAVGRALAEAIGASFLDADDLHPPANIARMAAGLPLDDEARDPWLRAVHAATLERLAAGDVVLACSALKPAYRTLLLDGVEEVLIVLLAADRGNLEDRLAARSEHFMPASLVASQLADLDPPPDARSVDATRNVMDIVAEVVSLLVR